MRKPLLEAQKAFLSFSFFGRLFFICLWLELCHRPILNHHTGGRWDHQFWLITIMIHPEARSISTGAQSGIQEEDGHLNKVRILFGIRKRGWEWMSSWQRSVHDTYLLPEERGYIFPTTVSPACDHCLAQSRCNILVR